MMMDEESQLNFCPELDAKCASVGPPHCLNPKLRRMMQDKLADIMKARVVHPSKSLYSALVILVQQKDGSSGFVWITEN